MRIGIFVFRPQFIPTTVLSILVPVFVGLGFWQLDRADQKRVMAAAQQARRAMPALNLEGDIPQFDMIEHRSLVARGVFQASKSVFIENRKYRGNRGFHVITPLRIDGHDRYLLVNRGWIDTPPKSEVSPSDEVTVTGRAVVPEPPAIQLGEGLQTKSLLPHWPYFTLEAYATWSGLDVYPFLVLQSPEDSHGFIRAWVSKPTNQTMHLGYALQWFAFALIVLVIWARLSIEKQSSDEVFK